MGTDEDAVEADSGLASMTRENGDGSAAVEGGTDAAEGTWTSGNPDLEVSEMGSPEEPDEATPAMTGEADESFGSKDESGSPETAYEPAALGEPVLDESGSLDEPAEQDEFAAPDEPAAEPGQDWDTFVTPSAMSQMVFVDVVLLLPATHPVVVLQEADAPFRELRIPVGGAEGIAISYAARKLATPRPLTHELFTHVLEEFGMTLDVVRITEVRGTAFTAEMVVSGRLGTRVIDCRPSDAIALALRHRLPVPIMVEPVVLELAGTDPMGAN